MLHAFDAAAVARFDPMAAARRYADTIIRSDPDEAERIGSLASQRRRGRSTRSGSPQRAPCIVHCDLHHGNVLTADRIYFIDWEYAQVGDPLLDLACVMTYYPRALAHGALLLEASGLDRRRCDAVRCWASSRSVFTLLTYLWYRARRVTRSVPATDLQLESAALRRLLSLAPGRPTSAH